MNHMISSLAANAAIIIAIIAIIRSFRTSRRIDRSVAKATDLASLANKLASLATDRVSASRESRNSASFTANQDEANEWLGLPTRPNVPHASSLRACSSGIGSSLAMNCLSLSLISTVFPLTPLFSGRGFLRSAARAWLYDGSYLLYSDNVQRVKDLSFQVDRIAIEQIVQIIFGIKKVKIRSQDTERKVVFF